MHDGHALAASFSYITNYLAYCGPKSGHEIFREYLLRKDPSKKEEIAQAITKFEALYPYLQFIAKKTGQDFMDYKVVEAYWIGNDLLDQFTADDMKEMVNILVKRGLPQGMATNLIDKMPQGAIPYHTFHVAYVGVGNVTGHVETTTRNMDNCRISVGKVVKTIDDKVIVLTDALDVEGNKLYLRKNETKTVVYDREMLPLEHGDYIAIHWGFACKKLNEDEVKRINKYTYKAIDAANKVH